MIPSFDQRIGWHAWVAARPEKGRLAAERSQPWNPYRLKPGALKVGIYSFHGPDEDSDDASPVTVTVDILHEHNPRLIFERRVFGIDPDDLELVVAGEAN